MPVPDGESGELMPAGETGTAMDENSESLCSRPPEVRGASVSITRWLPPTVPLRLNGFGIHDELCRRQDTTHTHTESEREKQPSELCFGTHQTLNPPPPPPLANWSSSVPSRPFPAT